MAVYIVGDIQGCYEPLARGLEKVNFDTSKDTLYCAGDLVNRGPQSLEVINLLKSLKTRCHTVLGNHDIHLLALLYEISTPRKNDTLNSILESNQANDIANWLRKQPLLITNDIYRFALSHAGIYPWWSIEQAKQYAQEVENIFQNETKCIQLLKKLYGNTPKKWNHSLKNISRQRFIINAFTRMRFVSPNGALNLEEKGFKGQTRKNRLPWYIIGNNYNNSSSLEHKIVFGHWSSLGFLNEPGHLCLDTGYIWGGKLTFVKLKKHPKKPKKIKKSKIFTIQG